jgi:thiamine transport system substrate-binding protein
MTHDSFAISEDVLAVFEIEHNATVDILLSGDAGTMVNQAVLSKDAPLADVLYGVDNTFLSRALDEDIFIAYESPALAKVDPALRLDPDNGAVPINYGDVCINFDEIALQEMNVQAPTALSDLIDPAYSGLLVVQNPATSSPGLAFLLATVGVFGDPGYLDFWMAMVKNEVIVVNDWETAYFSEFTLWGGRAPFVVSYGSSPPFEVLFAEDPIDAPSTAAIVADDTCFRQVEFAGILQGTENQDLAQAWIDFMLSTPFQEDIPLNMFVFPVNPDAQLDQAFVDYLAVPDKPVLLDPDDIAANRERWIEAWTEIVLR